MASAADAVENEPADPDRRVVHGEAVHQRRHGLRLPGTIDHQDNGQAQQSRELRGGAPAVRRAVEEAHGALDRQQPLAAPGETQDRLRLHGIGIEIDAFMPAGKAMETGVDIVRARLGGRHLHAAPGKQAQQRQRHQRLAASRGRGRYENTLSRHGTRRL